MDIKSGSIVLSTAGRDSDRIFAVVGIVDSDYVLISDGRVRRLEAPKKKKLKHLKFISQSEEITQKISDGKLTNNILKKELSVIMY
ncbi:MAG: hypothetical protein IJO74_05590 [Clostridia bacterium]|nr:hypothetical protein [Clostridia bacterium]